MCNVFTQLRIRFVRSEGSGCVGLSKILVFTEFRNPATIEKLKKLNKSKVPSIYGDYNGAPDTPLHSINNDTTVRENDMPDWCIAEL